MQITKYHALPNGDYAPTMYIGPWNQFSYTNIATWASPAVGQYTCTDGAFSGEVCGNQIMSVGAYFGGVGPGDWTQQVYGTAAAGDGDSGGGMQYYDSSNKVVALGLINGSDTAGSATCGGIQSFGDRHCSAHVFSVDIGAALNALNEGLVTG